MVTFSDMKVQQIVDDPTLSIEDKIKSNCAATNPKRAPCSAPLPRAR